MLGLMQSQPLLISSLIEFAERHHGDAPRHRVVEQATDEALGEGGLAGQQQQ